MDEPLSYYYRGEPEDIKMIFSELEKIDKPGQFINLSRSQMWRTDKDKLLNACNSFILFMQSHYNNHNYWLSMDESIFFYHETIPITNADKL